MIEELKEATEKLGKWLRKNQARSGTTEFREAILLHRMAIDMLERLVTAS